MMARPRRLVVLVVQMMTRAACCALLVVLLAALPASNIHPGKDLSFYSYPGSLTQPPCTEGVDWYVTAAPMDATKEEIQHVAKAIKAAKPTKKGNNRATQPLGSRKVLVSHTGFQHHVKQWKRNC